MRAEYYLWRPRPGRPCGAPPSTRSGRTAAARESGENGGLGHKLIKYAQIFISNCNPEFVCLSVQHIYTGVNLFLSGYESLQSTLLAFLKLKLIPILEDKIL